MFIEQLAQQPALYASCLILFGLLVGSFLNVVILRLPKSLQYQWISQCQELLAQQDTGSAEQPPTLSFPASHCPKCKAPLKWWQNTPVISYILLRGKCHSCQQTIPLRYPLVEILTAVLTLISGLTFPETAVLPWILIAVCLLISMTFIDLDTQLLPDNLTLPLMWLGLLFSMTAKSFVTPQEAILGAAIGYMVLWLLFQVHYFITKKEGMGYGDFKLLAAAGAWLGLQHLPYILLIAAISGLFVAMILIIFKNHQRDQAISFGPYLALGFLINLFWGKMLISQYLGFIGVTA